MNPKVKKIVDYIELANILTRTVLDSELASLATAVIPGIKKVVADWIDGGGLTETEALEVKEHIADLDARIERRQAKQAEIAGQ